MFWKHAWLTALAVASLALFETVARADYVDAGFAMVGPGQQSQGVAFPGGDAPGAVVIQAYDGQGAAGGGLQAGQVRLTLYADGPPVPPVPGQTLGINSLAFNTNLNLAATQIQLPAGWQLSANPAVSTTNPSYAFGTFQWGGTTSSNIDNGVSVLITGLGADATLAHFLVGTPPAPNSALPFESAVFAAHAVAQTDGATTSSYWLATNAEGINGLPSASPEPGTLVLAGFALGGLLGRHAARKKLWKRNGASGA